MAEVTRLPAGKATPEDALEWLRVRVEAGEVQTLVMTVATPPRENGTHDMEVYRVGRNHECWYLLSWCARKLSDLLFD